MNIISLSTEIAYARDIARWYLHEWEEHLFPATLDDIEKNVLEKVNLDQPIPHYFIALEGDEITGVVEHKFRENVDYPEYLHWIGGLYVRDKSRGQGVASALIEFSKTRFLEFGVKEIFLQCDNELTSMYAKYGFSTLHSAKHGKLETIVMSYKPQAP